MPPTAPSFPPPPPTQALRLKLAPPPPPINQHPLLIKQHPLPAQQLQLLLDIQPARRIPPIALKPTDILQTPAQQENISGRFSRATQKVSTHARRGNTAMTRDLGRERVVAEGAADGAGGGVQGGGEGFVGGYAAGRDLSEEGVDALVRGRRGEVSVRGER